MQSVGGVFLLLYRKLFLNVETFLMENYSASKRELIEYTQFLLS